MVEKFAVEGPLLITSRVFADDRGFFCERFKAPAFKEQGLPTGFVQDNYSRSKPGVLRGLHYQWDPPQGKLVTCARGRILDVAVDIRANSPTFGRHVAVELSGDRPQWFWIPAGFAHGFLVLGDEEADVMYKVDNVWNGAAEGSLLWKDEKFGIPWPNSSPLLSGKDEDAPSFEQYRKNPRF